MDKKLKNQFLGLSLAIILLGLSLSACFSFLQMSSMFAAIPVGIGVAGLGYLIYRLLIVSKEIIQNNVSEKTE